MLIQTTETTGSTIATQGEGQLIKIAIFLLFLEDLGPYSSHGSFELMISANFLWLSCRRVYLDLIFLNLPISCNIAICILKRKSSSVAGKFKLICKYLLCLDLLCQIKSVIFAKSICSEMD